jgi:PTH1 family peptidyl-tRNA hydrolase
LSVSILFGLGNPGERYRHTRHNLGLEALGLLARRHSLSWERGKGSFRFSLWNFAGREITLLESLTYMNDSGRALEEYAGVNPGILLVLGDDMSLSLGRLRIRAGGGSGGHLGLESIITSLGTERFARMRLGIGSPPARIDWSEFVLMPFLAEEREAAGELLESAADALETIVKEGLDRAMQVYNRRSDE